MTNKVLFGLEIEGVLNVDIHNELYEFVYYDEEENSDDGEYRFNNSFFNFWDLKHDGSLSHFDEFNQNKCVEFVTPILKSKSEFFKSLKEFENILSFKGKYELNEVLSFNSTTGTHIHLSVYNPKDKYINFRKKIDIKVMIEFRKLFFNKIENSKLLNKSLKKSILEHYYRSYARQSTLKSYILNSNKRYHEFNTASENVNKGIEWRSFNLRDVQTWEEFNELFKIAYECLNFLIEKATKGYLIKDNIRLSQKRIIKEQTEKINLLDDEDLKFNETRNLNLNQNEINKLSISNY